MATLRSNETKASEMFYLSLPNLQGNYLETLDVSTLPAGSYFLTCSSREGVIRSKILVIVK